MKLTVILVVLSLFGCLDTDGLDFQSSPAVSTCATMTSYSTSITRIVSDGKDATKTGDGVYVVGEFCSVCTPMQPTSLVQGPDDANQCIGEYVYRYTWVTYGECVNVGTPQAMCPRIDHVADVYFRATWKASI
jgi:hypothetical protein